MAENEIEFSAEVGLPDLFPGTARASVRFRRKWETRVEAFGVSVREKAGLSEDELEHRLSESERVEDLALNAMSRAARAADPDYREALAQCVALALADEAQIDELEHLVEQLVRFTPLDFRALVAIYERNPRTGRLVHSYDLVVALNVDQAAVQGTLASLTAHGMLSTRSRAAAPKPTRSRLEGLGGRPLDSQPPVSATPGPPAPHEYVTNAWGVRAALLVASHQP